MAGGSRRRPQRGNYRAPGIDVVIQFDLDPIINADEYSEREFRRLLGGGHRNLRRVDRRNTVRADAGRDYRRRR
jgi:hypothetical protein